jgi:hypothetical protein
MTRSAPCVAWDGGSSHCVASLLFGASCCPHGDCALCEEQQDYMRRVGYHESVVARAWLSSRSSRRALCPVCGFPPPPPPDTLPPLPRLDRSDRVLSGSPNCRVCDEPLAAGLRHYCSARCRLQRRRDLEGWGDGAASHAVPRSFRVAQ